MAPSLRWEFVRARRLAKAADIACALSVDALQASQDSFLSRIHDLRPLPGQAAAAGEHLRAPRRLAIIEAHRWCDRVQDAYSLRCAAQVHGAARDLIDHVARTASVELNAATDNPLVFPEDGVVLSNGNFHGQPVRSRSTSWRSRSASWRASRSGGRSGSSTRRSRLAAGVPRAERRPQLRLHDPAVRGRVARQREQGAEPSRERGHDPDERRPGGSCVDGQRAGLKAWQVLANAERVVAIELPRGRAGGRVPRAARAGCRAAAARELVRSVSPRLGDDRSLSDDIEAIAAAIRDGSAVAAVEAETGELQ
jgi:histidine ammonia-lyase